MGDGWRIEFFNDCDDLDYVNSVATPDGREGDFDDWLDTYPLDLLTDDERDALETKLKGAT